MKTFIVVGAPGQGKSEWVKNAIRERRSWVFDVQNEYGSRTKYPGQKALGFSDNPNAVQARYVPKSMYLNEDVKRFMEMAYHKRDTHVVFEEATIFLQGRQDQMIKTLIVNRIHSGNVYYFLFHSINSIPPRIMEMCNFVVLHKTLDEEHIVSFKYGRLFHHFLDLQPLPDGSSKIIKLM
jgi:hypothetical protein